MATTTQAPPAVGTFCWNELLSTDTAKTEAFYTKLLGWKTERKDMGEMGTYTIFTAGKTQAAGMMANPEPGAPSQWLPYIAVANVDESAKKAEKLGGKICVPATDIPGIGRFSVIVDPAGATFSLFKASSPGA